MRWLKFLLLLGSCIGAVGFFLPFRYTAGRAESARDLVGTMEEDWSLCDPRETRGMNLPVDECLQSSFGPDGERIGTPPHHYAYPPLFFASCAIMAVLAVVAIARRRLGGLVALLAIVVSIVAIVGPIRETRHHHVLGWGAALLAISGAIALLVGIAGMLWTEVAPPRAPRPPPSNLPEARVLSG